MIRFAGLLAVCWAVAGCHGSEAPDEHRSAAAGSNSIDGAGVVKLGSMSSKAPSSWKEEKPSGMNRIDQFKLPKSKGDTEDADLVVFFFPGGAGAAADNIKRWQGMFVPPAGKTIDEVSRIEKFKVGPANVTYLDVSGTFLSKNPPFDPKAKTEKKPEFRRFGVIFESPGGTYYLTATGPARTLEEHKKGFDEWLKNFK